MNKHALDTYDESVRRTVPEPDSSFRVSLPAKPSREADDALRARVADALSAVGFTGVGLEVVEGRVLLRGEIRDEDTRNRLEHFIASLEGVDWIDDRIHLEKQ